jgi:hypothetical protein
MRVPRERFRYFTYAGRTWTIGITRRRSGRLYHYCADYYPERRMGIGTASTFDGAVASAESHIIYRLSPEPYQP